MYKQYERSDIYFFNIAKFYISAIFKKSDQTMVLLLDINTSITPQVTNPRLVYHSQYLNLISILSNNHHSFEQSLPNMYTFAQSMHTRIWFLTERHM